MIVEISPFGRNDRRGWLRGKGKAFFCRGTGVSPVNHGQDAHATDQAEASLAWAIRPGFKINRLAQ